jgi:hypothetical protein
MQRCKEESEVMMRNWRKEQRCSMSRQRLIGRVGRTWQSRPRQGSLPTEAAPCMCATNAHVPRHRSIPRSPFSPIRSSSAAFALLTSTLKCIPTRFLDVGTRRTSITTCHASCQTSTIKSTFTGTQLRSCSKQALPFRSTAASSFENTLTF